MARVENKARYTRQAKAELLFNRADAQGDLGNLRSAFRLFLAAAKLGDASAQNRLGSCYSSGNGVRSNCEAALYWYKRSYRQGDYSAASNIGNLFMKKKNLKQALRWYQLAIKNGDVDANLDIAKIYFQTGGDIDKIIQHLELVCNAKRGAIAEISQKEAQAMLKKLRKK